jgi:hypothetical protein
LRPIKVLVFVEDWMEQDDEEKYEIAFENVDWYGMEEGDKVLWQDLSCCSH